IKLQRLHRLMRSLAPAPRCFRCSLFYVSEINAIAVEHGRSTAPNVEVVARHSEHLICSRNALRAKLIRVRRSPSGQYALDDRLGSQVDALLLCRNCLRRRSISDRALGGTDHDLMCFEDNPATRIWGLGIPPPGSPAWAPSLFSDTANELRLASLAVGPSTREGLVV